MCAPFLLSIACWLKISIFISENKFQITGVKPIRWHMLWGGLCKKQSKLSIQLWIVASHSIQIHGPYAYIISHKIFRKVEDYYLDSFVFALPNVRYYSMLFNRCDGVGAMNLFSLYTMVQFIDCLHGRSFSVVYVLCHMFGSPPLRRFICHHTCSLSLCVCHSLSLCSRAQHLQVDSNFKVVSFVLLAHSRVLYLFCAVNCLGTFIQSPDTIVVRTAEQISVCALCTRVCTFAQRPTRTYQTKSTM